MRVLVRVAEDRVFGPVDELAERESIQLDGVAPLTEEGAEWQALHATSLRHRLSRGHLAPSSSSSAEWMVLRPVEIELFAHAQRGWLAREYETAAIFDVSRQIREAAPAHPATLYDATFVVFGRAEGSGTTPHLQEDD